MHKHNWFVAVLLMVGTGMGIVRLMMATSVSASPEKPAPALERISLAESGLSESEWRSRLQSPTHWRQVMLVK
ncbi:hypothetical protein [Tuwongella immobilis]|uniref:Uncharacterized protein n=1 Tax=Tuwongella immobilis TaxID=692036 RepID=A0A6C2YU27_9BACT|nr:hypothetical protein [Tuwongella immobilis]VIP05248.1 unnamed protein product [Tuwongella immobilis]VTS07852.1 unnamed protein product [Tuwongella immobilis]